MCDVSFWKPHGHTAYTQLMMYLFPTLGNVPQWFEITASHNHNRDLNSPAAFGIEYILWTILKINVGNRPQTITAQPQLALLYISTCI